MNNALGMYLVIKAEHATLLAERAERERMRGFPRTAPTRRRPLQAVAGWARGLLRSGRADAAPFAS